MLVCGDFYPEVWDMADRQGLIHIYTGDGKGKTTAALGLGIRAYGAGMRVLFVQFLKGRHSCERTTLAVLGPRFDVRCGARAQKFVWEMADAEKTEAAQETERLFQEAAEAIQNGKADLVILDEIFGALSTGMIGVSSVTALLKAKPDAVEVALTGRDAPDEIIRLADYVTEARMVKHPMARGISARKGIEF
jgi:cob(I)alamin adenosyltransferase